MRGNSNNFSYWLRVFALIFISRKRSWSILRLSLFSAAVTHEHLKDRALFSLPPPPPGANPAEYYLMASASQRSPYGDLLMQSGAAAAAAAAAAHLPDYISPVDGEERNAECTDTFTVPINVCINSLAEKEYFEFKTGSF